MGYAARMTATLHRIGAGDGYRYYTAMVASADERREQGERLGDYYTRSGNPPGVWMGRGISDLGVTGEVKESQLQNLLGLGLHPDSGAQLGQRYRIYATVDERIAARLERVPYATVEQVAAITADEQRKGERQAVAGFDSTFSPVKSVSVAWALATPPVAQEIEQAHQAAVASTLEWIEREAITARAGADGIAHIDVGGVSAAAFTHRTSRAGDPDLHTHVVISNKVLARTPDGERRWLTLDSRGLYKANVAFSERYNRVLEDEISRRLGWQFAPRSDQAADALAPIRELTHIPEPLITAFSQRRQQIEVDYASRVREYREKHGHEPPKAVQYELAQAACLAHRPAKGVGSGEQSERDAWEQVARSILTEHERGKLREDLQARDRQVGALDALGADESRAIAVEVIQDLQERRSDWTDRHVVAAAQRHTATVRFTDSAARDRAIAAIVTATHQLDDVLEVSAPERVESPQDLRRADGTPVWEAPASRRRSTYTLLAAESRLLDAAREHADPHLHAGSMHLVLTDHTLADDQLSVVRQLATGNKRLQLLVGPAGTGKTTTMKALVDVWQRSAGSPVRGLAPTAAAASVLRTETGMDQAVTIDYWATLRKHGDASARFSEGELVIVDEAGMAGTLNLDRVVRAAVDDGAHVVLVGDPHQLAAIASGGVLRLIQNDVGAAELSTVWRFADRDPETGERVLRQWEADASLGIRLGRDAAIEPYIEHGRVRGGSRDALTEDIYRAWVRDQDSGFDSVMIATDNATVQALCDRARTDRITAGIVDPTRNVTLRNGSQASVGDIIVTRKNDRELRVGGDFVKNGDLWTVTGFSPAGDVEVTGKHGHCVLPADYAARNVELGYAMTAHRAQGLTVDHAHVLVDDTLTRELLYVAMTRGRLLNHVYAVTEHVLDAEAERPADPDQPARAVLKSVLERSEAAVSATEAIRNEEQHAASVATQLQRWAYVRELRDPDAAVLDLAAPDLAAGLREDPAWPYLRHTLHWHAPTAEGLRQVIQQRTLADAESPARVLAARLNEQRQTAHPGDWLPAASGDQYADALIEAARARAAELGAQAAHNRPAWTGPLGPVPRDPDERHEWQERAGMIAAYREAHDITTSSDPIGPEPRDPAERDAHQAIAGSLPADDVDERLRRGSPEEIRRSLAEARAERDQAGARLAAAEAVAGRQGPGPRAEQLERDLEAWRATLDRLDRAVAADTAARESEQRAYDVDAQLAHHVSHRPVKRRDQAAWSQTEQQLREQQQHANSEAGQLRGEADVAARGLPPERREWDQLRSHAAAGLADAETRRDEARRDDLAERQAAAEQLPRLHEHIEHATARHEQLQHYAEIRGVNDESKERVRDDEPVPERHDIGPESQSELGR